MDEVNVVLERHGQHIKSLQHQVDDLRPIVTEIRTISATLVQLTTELKHTNEHLEQHEKEIKKLSEQPARRWDLIATTMITAIVSSGVGFLFSQIF